MHDLHRDLLEVAPDGGLVVGLILAVLAYICLSWYRTRGSTANRTCSQDDVGPASIFLRELSVGSSKGYDRNLRGMLHGSLLAVTEPGIIRAVGKHISCTCGDFVALEPQSMRVMKGTSSCHLVGRALFSRTVAPVDVTVGWLFTKDKQKDGECRGWAIVGFNVGVAGSDFFKHIDPDDFTELGERLTGSLVSNSPTYFHALLAPQLKGHYGTPREIYSKLKSVLRLCGRLDTDASRMVLTKSSINAATGSIELTFRVRASIRDAEVGFSLIIINMQCFVGRYSVVPVGEQRRKIVIDI